MWQPSDVKYFDLLGSPRMVPGEGVAGVVPDWRKGFRVLILFGVVTVLVQMLLGLVNCGGPLSSERI